MQSLTMAPPLRLESFDLDLDLVRKLGYWSSPDEKLLRWVRNTILFSFVFVLMIPSVISIVENGIDNGPKTIRASGELMSICMHTVSFLTIIRKKRALEDVVKKLLTIFERLMDEGNPDTVRLLRDTEALSKKAKFYMVRNMAYLTLLYCVSPFIYTVFCIYFLFYEPVPFSTGIESNFYYLNIHSNIFIYTAYMACAIFSIWMLATSTGLKNTLFGNIFNHCTINFRILKWKIELLDSMPEPQAETMNLWKLKLKNIIDFHNDAFECVQILEETINGVFLAHYIGSVGIMCLQILCFTELNLDIYMVLRLFIIFSYIGGEIMLFSWMGDRLAESSSNIADAVYETQWYSKPVWIRKTFQLILARSQRSTGVTVGRFFNLDMLSLGSSIKSIYTYFLFIKEVYNGMQ